MSAFSAHTEIRSVLEIEVTSTFSRIHQLLCVQFVICDNVVHAVAVSIDFDRVQNMGRAAVRGRVLRVRSDELIGTGVNDGHFIVLTEMECDSAEDGFVTISVGRDGQPLGSDRCLS